MTAIIRVISAAFILCSAQAALAKGQIKAPIEGIFVSIDGLSPSYVEALSQAGMLTGGFQQLQTQALRTKSARTTITTLTAPSHISTITCSPPAAHGIVGNNFLVDGAPVSGFTHPFATEPMWITAMRQGKNVLSLAYVGADGNGHERTATWGLAYPDSRLTSRAQLLEKEVADLEPLSRLPKVLGNPGWRSASVTLTLNPQTREERLVHIIVLDEDGAEVVLDDDLDPGNGFLLSLTDRDPRADLFFVEESGDSDKPGRKRRVFVRKLRSSPGIVRLYFSGAGYNNAYPESYRTLLDERDLVWPQYGLNAEASFDELFEAKTTLENFLISVAEYSSTVLPIDVLLYYNPIIDSLGHQLEGLLPRPFNPASEDEVTAAYVQAYQLVDSHLERLFSLAGSDSTIALMGDHGMAPSIASVNFASFVGEQYRFAAAEQIMTSGAMALIYGDLGSEPIQNLFQNLESARFRDLPVIDGIMFKGEGKVWHYGEANAVIHASLNFWFEYRPQDDHQFASPPAATGMHGHRVEVAAMDTGFYLLAPTISPAEIGIFELVDAVPTFLGRLGLSKAETCDGRDILAR